MLNIGKLRRGGENYYLNSVARGVEDYYLGSGEAPGYWLASGSRGLGLEGEVAELELRRVLGGNDPASAEALIKKTKTQRVPGFDLTFRAPKSVSILHALGPDAASPEVVAAHDAAVSAALSYIEHQASAARRGAGGRRRIHSQGFVAAAFRHRTSRAGDPLLHTHVLVANLIKGVDDRWGAVDGKALYRYAKTAGYLYQAHLRAELSRRLGVQWAPVRRGSADIDGIPRAVIEAFSQRRSEIELELAEGGATSARAAQAATLKTRSAKDYKVDSDSLQASWRERAVAAGLTELETTIGRSVAHWDKADVDAAEALLTSPEGLTQQASTFSRQEVLQGLAESLPQGASVTELEAMADSLLASGRVVPLKPSYDQGLPHDVASLRRYTTQEMLEREREVIELAISRRSAGIGIARPEHVDQALRNRPTLFEDQCDMVRSLTCSGMGVQVVIGKAGTGKTFALAAARDAWERSGKTVIGCALAARAAQELQAGSGIRSFTLAGLLTQLDRGESLVIDSVVVVDEAGMVGTRTLGRLLEHATQAGAKVVLVGDDHQLPEIDAGGALRAIRARLDTAELSEVRRQPLGWEREVLDLVRQGRAAEAIDAYQANDRVFIDSSPERTRQLLVDHWWDSRRSSSPAVMIAARRSEVMDLNRRARRYLTDSGVLQGPEIECAQQRLCKGDEVMALRNDKHLGVINGTRGTVMAVDPAMRTVTVATEAGAEVVLPAGYLDAGHLTHSYAITGHKSQGMTTERAFVLGDETLYREWAYVAMSRGKLDNRLYVAMGEDLERDELGGEVAKIEDAVGELTQALARSRAKELALEQTEETSLELSREL